MLHFRSIALSLEAKARQLLETVTDPVMLEKLLGQLKDAYQYRTDSQKCASDLAPYVHPRLQSITLGGDKNNPIAVRVTGGLPQKAVGL
jgi:hypothetical protein